MNVAVVLTGEGNHFKELAKELNRQRVKNISLCDVTLQIGEKGVRAHRAVLSARSSYFNSMFSGNFIEKQAKLIDLSSVFSNVESLESIIDYIYTGRLRLTWTTLEEVLHASALFLLEEACELCSQFMLQNMRLNNALHLWALADQYSLFNLSKFFQRLFVTRFHDYYIHRTETLDIEPQLLINIFSKNNAEICQHIPFHDLMSFLLLWTNQNLEEREDKLKEVLCNENIQEKYSAVREIVNAEEFETRPFSCVETSLQKLIGQLCSSGESTTSGRSSVTFYEDEEALILQTTQGSLGSKQCLQLYAYTPRTNRWWQIPNIRLNKCYSNTDAVIGFLDGRLVMSRRLEDIFTDPETTHDVYTIDLKSGNIINLPVHDFQADGHDHNWTYFVFQNTLLYIDHVDLEGNDNDVIYLGMYKAESKSWHQIAVVPLPQQDGATDRCVRLMSDVIVQTDHAYVCCFKEHLDEQSAAASDLYFDIYIMVLSKVDDGFSADTVTVTRNVRPIDENFDDFSLCGSKDKVLFSEVTRSDWYSEDSAVDILSGETCYTLSTAQWHTQRVKSRPLPSLDLPLQFHSKYSGLCVVKGSHEQGIYYQARRISPFISELWKFDVHQHVWSKIKPPPYDIEPIKLETCRIPIEVLRDLEMAQYQDTTEHKPRSPLAIYKLSNVKAKIIKTKAETIETDNEEEEDLYDRECRLEEEWLAKSRPPKRSYHTSQQHGQVIHSDDSDTD